MSPRALITGLGIALAAVVGGCASADEARAPAASDPAAQASAPRAGASQEASRSAAPAPDAVTQLIRDALRSDGSITRSDLVQRLGPPPHTEQRPIPNQYDPTRTDTVRTLQYPGVKALIYDVTGERKTFLIRLALTTDRYASPEGLRVGDSEERVLERIGPPTDRDTARSEWIYEEDKTTPTALVIQMQDGRVAQLAWEFYFS